MNKPSPTQQGTLWLVALAVLCTFSVPAAAQFELPGTDLWLVHLAQGEVVVEPPPRRLTTAPGYDNQPAFSGNGRRIYFTRGDGQGYTDIAVLDIASGGIRPITQSPLSEFSALPHWRSPGGEAGSPDDNAILAMVQVQSDGAQWLVSYDQRQQHFTRLNPATAVGYHTWLGEHGWAQFIVADPPQLEYRPDAAAEPRLIASNVGRGLFSPRYTGTVPQQLWFVQQQGGNSVLHHWQLADNTARALTPLPEARQDFVRHADGRVWVGVGTRLYHWHPRLARWRLAADLSAYGIRDITRLALSPSSDALVLVSAE